jgi:hypothetical protein
LANFHFRKLINYDFDTYTKDFCGGEKGCTSLYEKIYEKNEKGLIMLYMVTMVCVYETYLLGNKPMIGSQWRI